MVLGGSLVFLSGTSLPWIDGDTWNYLAWVRDYLDSDRLAAYNPYFGTETGVSRILINGFFLEQAALSWLSGIDPVTLALRYLSPTLTAVSLLAFYALGRRLFGPGPALAAGCLYALFLIVNLDGTLPLFGKEFLVRIIQDKGVARFIFMTVALCFAVGYLERRKFGHLFLFGLSVLGGDHRPSGGVGDYRPLCGGLRSFTRLGGLEAVAGLDGRRFPGRCAS